MIELVLGSMTAMDQMYFSGSKPLAGWGTWKAAASSGLSFVPMLVSLSLWTSLPRQKAFPLRATSPVPGGLAQAMAIT
jgi:hypothetical protein